METLRQQLDGLINRLETADQLRAELTELISVYPFNEFEYIIAHLLATDQLTLEEYYAIRSDYIDRNLYLYLFEISAPRGFGETWAQGHLKELVPELQRPRKNLDPLYSGQYDFLLAPGIRIEVKASRAVGFRRADEPLYIKALSSDSVEAFDMNFQQLKPRYCDVFVWLAVWRDIIRHWVLSSFEVENSRYYSTGQHRGNIGEGQLHLNQTNIQAFDPYLIQARDLEQAIRAAFAREQEQRSQAIAPPEEAHS